ncbi:MSMEG_1061 family FMN-dependent PPOX-type flavoprotein [Chitinasiproducens palmae]|uniref:Pyridoxamine 5'-phosphate oxidase N-terminal domain-containing protein n=1 Tax=Chitinasiproducens palmae TaxID=1770053 RepID=A0A1H2PMD8_9BURK|nr:MSMEG_1061 family FMN-dependent PPOX-type flavoprotein [Chitinasiproducens palmae]SDV47274.1 hypothetical protein SAMN05216551_102431 [Chitinasiproducens palmae]
MTGHDAPDLAALYNPPAERIQQGVLDHLIGFHEAYLKVATFFCLATGSDNGLDASPRGGAPGFVHVLDPHTVAFADWPGNNRIESMKNVERDARVGMLFLFPGLEVFMRINGRASLSVEPALLERLREGERIPKTAMVVSVDEVLFHCGKAINRARLWADTSRLARNDVPSVGQMAAAMVSMKAEEAAGIDAHYEKAVKTDLY